MRPDKQMFFNFDKCKVRCPRSHGDDDEGDDSGDGDVGEIGYSGERGSGNDHHGFFAMMQASWWV